MSNRCIGITLKGCQCTRRATDIYCVSHIRKYDPNHPLANPFLYIRQWALHNNENTRNKEIKNDDTPNLIYVWYE